MDLKGKTIVVTGAARGLGQSMAGDFRRAYTIVDRVGLRITVDANITTPGKIKYFVRRREGGIPANNDAVKFLKTTLS